MEEMGLLGSRHYFQHLTPKERSQIKLFVNVDMIGFSPKGSLHASYDPLPFNAITPFFESVNRHLHLGFQLDAWREHRSDNLSAKHLEIPTISVFEDARNHEGERILRYPYYHTEEDSLEKINILYATHMTRLIAGLVYSAANTEVTWKNPPPLPKIKKCVQDIADLG